MITQTTHIGENKQPTLAETLEKAGIGLYEKLVISTSFNYYHYLTGNDWNFNSQENWYEKVSCGYTITLSPFTLEITDSFGNTEVISAPTKYTQALFLHSRILHDV